jgi:peptidoglycan hydrolase-like protein with peptidoglycan-binding domain
LSSATHRRTRIIAVGAAVLVLLVGGIWTALAKTSAAIPRSARAARLQVTSVTPADHTASVSGVAPVTVSFSQPVASTSPMPTVWPGIAGTWHGAGTSTLRFVPAVGFGQSRRVTLTIPGGAAGMRSADGARLASTEKVRFQTATYSTARLDELLAQLGYLPLTWTPSAGQTVPAGDAAGQLAAAYNAPQGQFTWKSGYPSELRRFWRNGTTDGLILQGAVMAFNQQHGLPADGVAGPGTWDALLTAVAAHDVNKKGYTYAIASEGNPETLTIWHNGHQVLQSDANTGIPASPTTIGTSPVYLKYYYQVMRGTDPDGTPYASPVYYVSYFRGSLAVHWYPRASYGFPQSLGCVELPSGTAKTAWQYLSYGSLVTVQPGSQTPSTSPVDLTT